MRILYKITFNDNSGYVESEDPQEIADLRAIKPGHVEALSLEIRIINDPQFRVFEQADDADQAIRELADEHFYQVTTRTLIDPQPEGLND